MPTYEYICRDCNHAWEEEQSIKDTAITTCPKCKEETAVRQISAGSFVLAGGGWAREGYSNK